MLTGATSQTVIKEYVAHGLGQRVRLVQGFDNDCPAYYAVDWKSGLTLPTSHPDHGRIQSQVLSCTFDNFTFLDDQFKQIVSSLM